MNLSALAMNLAKKDTLDSALEFSYLEVGHGKVEYREVKEE